MLFGSLDALHQINDNAFFFFCFRNTIGEEIEDTSLDAVFSEDDSEVLGEDSDSDGFLSEVEL